MPIAALAYKVRLGAAPVPVEPKVFWIRSTFAALGLAVWTLVMVGLTLALVKGAELPEGPIHLIVVMLYLPVGFWYMFWIFALDEMIEGLGVFALYLLLPGLPILLLGWKFDWWEPLVKIMSRST